MNSIDLPVPARVLARARPRRLQLLAATFALVASLAIASAAATKASASTTQASLIQDTGALNADPAGEMAQFKALGANTLRVLLSWYQIAPSASAKTAPHFSATNPNAYPAANWAQWDAIVQDAAADGIKVDLDITGAPPRWAQGAGVPSKYVRSHFGWKVNAADYGKFVRAVATRYSGHFTPTGATGVLPKVSLYSLWNEPNFGQNLGPQSIDATKKFAGYSVAPLYYRNLLRSGWSALKATAKGATILVGEFAGSGRSGVKNGQHPFGLPGQVAITSPVPYIQTLYCLDSTYLPLTGKAATVAGCPTSSRARRSFVKTNPALFDASAISMHPYASHYSPTAKASKIPSKYIVFPVIGRLTSELDHVTKAWHHARKYKIWSTEFGFQTSPPQTNKPGKTFPSPAKAAIYLNESEYLSYKNPRLASYAQYLLADPPNLKSTIPGYGLFASGLQFFGGKPKPGYDAYRLPLWLPKQTVNRNQRAEIWGGARPAAFGYATDGSPQTVQIQTESGGIWSTIDTVTVNRKTGYFDVHLKLAASGSMRLAYTYPADELGLPAGDAGTTVHSRTLHVTVR